MIKVSFKMQMRENIKKIKMIAKTRMMQSVAIRANYFQESVFKQKFRVEIHLQKKN